MVKWLCVISVVEMKVGLIQDPGGACESMAGGWAGPERHLGAKDGWYYPALIPLLLISLKALASGSIESIVRAAASIPGPEQPEDLF